MATPHRVAVVGAGVAGLAAAKRLAESQPGKFEVHIFEARTSLKSASPKLVADPDRDL